MMDQNLNDRKLERIDSNGGRLLGALTAKENNFELNDGSKD